MSPEEINILRESGFNVQPDQTLTFHSSKVPDGFSLPPVIYNSIRKPDGTLIDKVTDAPYRQSDYVNRWRFERSMRSIRRKR